MSKSHYDTLDVSPQATSAEIKQAYRRQAKRFHPDSQNETSDPEKIVQVNAAYEVLGDPHRRRFYDRQMRYPQAQPNNQYRQQRTADAQQYYQRYRRTAQDADAQLNEWLKYVYKPINRLIKRILSSLNEQIDELAADPFDDDLMAQFQAYLEQCREYLNQAQQIFRSQPNPPTVASAAASFYFCLNQLGDGIGELELFTLNYDENYLHTGQELFRIAKGLRYDAQEALKNLV